MEPSPSGYTHNMAPQLRAQRTLQKTEQKEC